MLYLPKNGQYLSKTCEDFMLCEQYSLVNQTINDFSKIMHYIRIDHLLV